MLSIRGIFDGQNIYPTEAIKASGRHNVIITFVDTVSPDDELRSFGTANAALPGWEDEGEDLYQDYLQKPAA